MRSPARITCGLLCTLTGVGFLALTAYCITLATLLGISAHAAPSFNTTATSCQSFSQSSGGSCGWHCSAKQTANGNTCRWCDDSNPPLCVGDMGNASWAPAAVDSPAACGAQGRAPTCSSCQYGADPQNGATPLLACAVGASLIVLATAAAACQNCLAMCGCIEGLGSCCCACCASLSGASAIGSCVIVHRALCSSKGCGCCGCQCIQPVGSAGGVAQGSYMAIAQSSSQYSNIGYETSQYSNTGYEKYSAPGNAGGEPLLLPMAGPSVQS